MRVIAKSTLKEFWNLHSDARIGLLSWYEKISGMNYASPQDVIKAFPGADYVGNERIVFNVAKNKYRLIASFHYELKTCWVKFVGTHKEYDRVDAKTVNIEK